MDFWRGLEGWVKAALLFLFLLFFGVMYFMKGTNQPYESGSFMSSFGFMLATLVLLSPIVLFAVVLGNVTRRLYRQIPEDLRFYHCNGRFFADKGGNRRVDPMAERALKREEGVKFKGMFTFWGDLRLTESYLVLEQKQPRYGQTAFLAPRFTMQDNFDALILETEDVAAAEKKGRYICFTTKNHGVFCFRVEKPEAWVAAFQAAKKRASA